MRTLSVIAIGFFLMNAGQLSAQTADPFGPIRDPDSIDPIRNPFEPSGTPAPRAADRRPSLDPIAPAPSDGAQQPASELASLYPHIRVGANARAQQRIENALNGEAAFDYLDQPLTDVVEDISFRHKIPILIDTRALDDFGIDTGTPITKSVRGISLRSALRLMLQELELTYVIRNEVLQITTPEVAEAAPSTRFYHVAELVPASGDGKVLVELIKTLVAPKTWCGSDRVGSIIYVDHLRSLAIRHTDEVLHEVEEVLATAKKLAEMQPAEYPHVYGDGLSIPAE